MTTRVYLSAPDIGPAEEAAVLRALRSGWITTTGPDVEAFEAEMAARVGVRHAVAVSSGTAALHLALLSAGVAPADVVVVPTLTFAATANVVVYTGAEPVFVDCEPETGNVDVALVERLLARCRQEGRRVGAVMPVDLFGRCADYGRLLPLCAAYGVPVIEDAAEALGATYRGRAAGSFGTAGVLSFNGNKIMTTSGGGMLLTGDARLAAHARYLATQARQPVPHYEHVDIGYNYRLSNILAALGRAQLGRLDGMIARRRALRERYAGLFSPIDGTSILGHVPGVAPEPGHVPGVAPEPGQAAGCTSNHWVTVLIVDRERTGWSARDLGSYLAGHGIETRPVWKPMHAQPVFSRARALLSGAADRLYGSGIVLPSGSVIDDATVAFVLDRIERFVHRRGGSLPPAATEACLGRVQPEPVIPAGRTCSRDPLRAT